ncbi:MAG: transcription-repair coupling factor [Hyphomicrobiaceae bacterium]
MHDDSRDDRPGVAAPATPRGPRDILIAGAPEGLDALVLAGMAREGAEQKPVIHVARDDRRLEVLETALKFFAPDLTVIAYPAWDCVPYDRVSPQPDIVARRLAALARLAAGKRRGPLVLLTTVNAMLQRVVPRRFIKAMIRNLAPGNVVDLADLTRRLEAAGYRRTSTVMERGEYAVRGGILDLFAPGRANPVRLDFFGDTLETMKPFDPETQRTTRPIERLTLLPVSEVVSGETATSQFRQNYVTLFGAVTSEDPLYESVSAGQRFHGEEHWLPLFHSGDIAGEDGRAEKGALETLLDYLPEATISLDHLAEDGIQQRFEQIADHYQARVEALETATFGAAPYKPLPPRLLYLDEREWRMILAGQDVRRFSPFEQPEGAGRVAQISMRGRTGRNFAAERAAEGINLFDAVVGHIRDLEKRGKRVVVAAWTPGARERLGHLLGEHGLGDIEKVESWTEAEKLGRGITGFAVLGLDHGLEAPEFAIIAEEDILGDRLVRKRRKQRKASDVLSEAASLSAGDLVVHVDHGIGRFVGLKTIEALGAPHDCLELQYHGGDRLYLPVENIELLSRYGSDGETVQLDRLGGAAWQARKARMKSRIRAIADELIKVAAMRLLKTAPVVETSEGVLEEFAALFPHEETEDQAASIEAVREDLASGRPMDRLVCGDVGFGKTEVALRAAFIAAMSGKQVAVVVPTTLLCRQHFATFTQRFKGLPVRIAQASRLVSHKELTEVKEASKDGRVDIVVGTHALLGKGIDFKNLGLIIIDEEQHFGVQHKERLKQLREDVHVLTLTATPIPRTLQLALSGVRELSLITTPPVDRLAVRTFVTPFDPLILREALLRERLRGGQSFYVCPRISDLDSVAEFLAEMVPELKVVRAHGQMPPGQLDDIMNGFYDGQYDVLLSTTIVESGLDIPRANTLVVHRADRLGLAQLYQLRGRVGRSKQRAYAYFTIPADKRLTEGADKRLKVLQSLDTLGAGFALASHDLDIRGAGNLLGEEQSGHIREVGYELYQQMLEEAIAQLKGGVEAEIEDQWSPQISLGTAVLIPESYVSDLDLRLGLYRRLSTIAERADIDAFAAELVDRFGALPEEVRHLLEIVEIKAYCRRANIAQIDAGPKGAVLSFRNKVFANPEGLIAYVEENADWARLQGDGKLVAKGEWDTAEWRLKNTRALARKLAEIAEAPKPDKTAGALKIPPSVMQPKAKPMPPQRPYVPPRKSGKPARPWPGRKR